ncbi:MAG: prolipoprotein diacylglyceryl transferase [Lachnospiraceae bacterium]|nr:prolipoprotein diacylglyceryl transferase [Lachnospiraceae bacterium]
MEYNINFPNLGIYLDHVGKNFSIGGFTIAFYGIAIAIGMVLGITVLMKRADNTGQNSDDYLDMAIRAMIFGIIGARIYYVVFSWDLYRDNLISVFSIREGGLAIYGGIIGGVLTLFVEAKRRHMNIGRILDTCVLGLPIGQIIGRWGNFFNREAFGRYTDSLFAMQLPVSAVRQNEITEQMWENLKIIGDIGYIQVHPTFLYEGIWNCCVLLVLFLRRNRTKFRGELFLTYAAGYGLGRFLIEPLRTDQLLIRGTSIPVSMMLSAAAAVIAVILIIFGRRRAAGKQTEQAAADVSESAQALENTADEREQKDGCEAPVEEKCSPKQVPEQSEDSSKY